MAIIHNNIQADETTFQYSFYEALLGDSIEVHIDRSTDGYIDGTIFEHKLNVTSYGKSKALSQALIYLARFNRDGLPVPKNIMLVSQEEGKVYLYNANDYIDIINNIPEYATLQASNGIEGFTATTQPEIFDFDLNNQQKSFDLISKLRENPEYVRIDINVHNVYGWSNYFYSIARKPKKVEFFKELRNPRNELREYINAWNGEESDFSLIMDLLNDPAQKKKLGAFYTPPLYAKKAVELVRKAIKDVPEGNDYIILDRCAGTGSLEYELSEEELKHVVVSTYELKEWHALKDRLGNLVKCVIPPIPADKDKYPDYDETTGFLSGANALEKDFLEREDIMQYVRDPKCNVIIFENPPYADDSGDAHKDKASRGNTKENYIASQMNKEVKPEFPGLVQSKDIANLFIWSGFKYYLTKPNDAYILFSPIKYWKTGHLVNKTFVEGFAFNREHFHANASAISCIYWKNIDDVQETLTLPAFDIENNQIKEIKDIVIKKVHKTVNEHLFDKRVFDTDTEDGIYSASTGLEGKKLGSTSTVNVYNDNILAYLFLVGFSFDPKHIYLTRNTLNYRKNGFYLRRDNFVNKLPLFCAKAYPQDEWYETDVYSTTADMGNAYENDKNFLKKCLIYTCLTQKNKCRSLDHCSDGRFYRNELCFDGDTAASVELQALLDTHNLSLVNTEKDLINDYNGILNEIKKQDNSGNYVYSEYNPNYSYGIFQISDEINIQIVIGYDRNGNEKKGPKYGDLNNMLIDFKKRVQKYYNDYIISDLFKYELLK